MLIRASDVNCFIRFRLQIIREVFNEVTSLPSSLSDHQYESNISVHQEKRKKRGENKGKSIATEECNCSLNLNQAFCCELNHSSSFSVQIQF